MPSRSWTTYGVTRSWTHWTNSNAPPKAGHELRGRLTGLWSYRVGVYRIIYELRDARTVRVVAIRHRGQAYDTDPR